MQYAKKLALVDPKLLEQLKVDREYEHIHRPAPAVAKTSLSLDITRILNDQTIPDDEKVKLYANALRRYVNVRNEIPVEPVERNEIPLLPPSPWPSSPLRPPKLFTLSSKPLSPVKRLHIRKKPAKWERREYRNVYDENLQSGKTIDGSRLHEPTSSG